ncbi:MAG: hypothetical protein P4M02_04335, partial [Clostridia bacterium]|nr:hypothetical protein [Clostridia bacterium]
CGRWRRGEIFINSGRRQVARATTENIAEKQAVRRDRRAGDATPRVAAGAPPAGKAVSEGSHYLFHFAPVFLIMLHLDEYLLVAKQYAHRFLFISL